MELKKYIVSFGLIQSSLVLIGSIWSYLVHSILYSRIRSCSVHSFMFSRLVLFCLIWSFSLLLGPFFSPFIPIWAFQSYLVLFNPIWSIRSFSVLFCLVWSIHSYLVLFCIIRSSSVFFDPLRSYLVLFGLVRSYSIMFSLN